jgi:hypothetical protein
MSFKHSDWMYLSPLKTATSHDKVTSESQGEDVAPRRTHKALRLYLHIDESHSHLNHYLAGRETSDAEATLVIPTNSKD